MFKYLFFLLMVVDLQGTAQVFITGKVLDNASGRPLENANIYLNNSTKGTITNELGQFKLGPFNNGFYELVATYVGYEPALYNTQINGKALQIIFRLNRRDEALKEVLVLSQSTRKLYLNLLREHFIGITEPAENTKILNEDAIRFIAADTKNGIKAYSDTTLIIKNTFTGYQIAFELQEFNLDRDNGRTSFFGYSRYIPLKPRSSAQQNRWQKHRKQCYVGSTLHFYHSLVNNSLAENQFSLTQILPPPIDSSGKTIRTMQIGKIVIEKQVLTLSDSLQQVYQFWCKGKLQVFYGQNPAGKEFLKSKTFLNQPSAGVISTIQFLEPAILDFTGAMANPTALLYSGWWAFEKLANMLPLDYRPQ
jgi:hypothetical protein